MLSASLQVLFLFACLLSVYSSVNASDVFVPVSVCLLSVYSSVNSSDVFVPVSVCVLLCTFRATLLCVQELLLTGHVRRRSRVRFCRN
jgi:NADH:ubiquinone oxidoreductase subunit B-like Fe-S oxidoreductase